MTSSDPITNYVPMFLRTMMIYVELCSVKPLIAGVDYLKCLTRGRERYKNRIALLRRDQLPTIDVLKRQYESTPTTHK